MKKFIRSHLKFLQRVLAKNNLYVAKLQPWNAYDLIYEIHENFLQTVSGILHIGGHSGQEAEKYNRLGQNVMWVEAIPEIFSQLQSNISGYRNQKAVNYLLGDQNVQQVRFNLANNNFGSSSIFDFGNQSNFKNVTMVKQISLKMSRLDTIFSESELDSYRHWIIDVQGAELLVLQGAGDLILNCDSIFIEISRREVYMGGARWEEIHEFLVNHGFIPLWIPIIDSHCDVLFIRKSSN